MFEDYPEDISGYYNPCRLHSIKSLLYKNPINSAFNELKLINLKHTSMKIKALPLNNKIKIEDIEISKVPYNSKADFLKQGIPCSGLTDFYLNDLNTTDKKPKTEKKLGSVFDNIQSLCMPKFLVSRPKIAKDKIDESFAFQVNVTADVNDIYKKLIPNPSWEWPFQLDTFQQQAIIGLEQGKSVFVAAHTSAGKTVVAEYAIAMCHNRGARVIYTSPIKALSNQKYREFKKTFGNEEVGLLTGDIKTGTNRYILVMTTEILHNMLKNDCSTLKDLDCVIMDEVHYLNDEARGHIWEQVMILLPKRVQLVMLSATVPNTMAFAEWLGRVRQTQIHVISTAKRPVPLEISLFTGTGRSQRNQFFRIMDANKNFMAREYQLAEEAKRSNMEKALKRLQAKPANPNPNKEVNYSKQHKAPKFQNPDLKKPSANYNTANRDHNQWLALFEALQEQNKLPVICFMFSRKRIQETVTDLKSLNFLSEVERSNVKRYFSDIVSKKITNPVDKQLPQILEMKELLSRGVGMHHAGLLPLLKEIVEILFSQGYVKVLFATETFAVGVNMPARCVVFDSLEKHDGNKKRLLLPGEFTQMAGRAGRRGLDTVGTVVVVIKPQNNIYSQDELKRTMIGAACQLESKFKISYNMILSLYRNRQFNIQHMIRHSFIEAGRLKNFEEDNETLEEATRSLEEANRRGLSCLEGLCCLDTVVDYYQALKRYRQMKEAVARLLEARSELPSFLSPGRLVLIDTSAVADFRESKRRQLVPGLVLALVRQESGLDRFKVRVLTIDDRGQDDRPPTATPGRQTVSVAKDPSVIPVRPLQDELLLRKIEEVVPKILSLPLTDINKVCHYKTKVDVQEVDKHWMTRFFRRGSWADWVDRSPAFRAAMSAILEGPPARRDPANYERDLGIKDHAQRLLLAQCLSYDSMESPLLVLPSLPGCLDCPSLQEHLEHVDAVERLSARVQTISHRLSDENLAFLPEYEAKVVLLKRLNFLNRHRDVIKLKGRIACEIESQELVVAELLLAGVFSASSCPADVAATLSCLVYESKAVTTGGPEEASPPSDLPPALREALTRLAAITSEVNLAQEACAVIGAEVRLHPGLVAPVRLWAAGGRFLEVAQLAEVQAGDLVRCLQRLCEMLRHCESAAKVMGDFGLSAVFVRAQERLLRGVVATASLYVDDGAP